MPRLILNRYHSELIKVLIDKVLIVKPIGSCHLLLEFYGFFVYKRDENAV